MTGGALPQRSSSDVRAVLRLAWPAVLSYLLNNFYRINDQYWLQGLGADAQAAVGAIMYVLIANFALLYLAAAGTLALVARATGAGDRGRADRVARHALVLGLAIGIGMALAGPTLAPLISEHLGLAQGPADLSRQYLETIFLLMPPMVLVVVVDHIFIGRGNTLVPMLLQLAAVAANFVLNPILIYGAGAAEALEVAGPFAGWASEVARALGIEQGLGMRGAALATGLSRGSVALVGLALLSRRYGLHLLVRPRPEARIFARIVRISAPVSGSIATYAAAYWILLDLVLRRLPDEVTAGLGIGFQVFEGVAFPIFIGLAMATSSLVGQHLGAGDRDGARRVVASARRVGWTISLLISAVFLFGARLIAPHFTQDPAVLRETLVYVGILAFTQPFVASQVISEKALVGAGHTRPILWITTSGDLARIPLAWLLALSADWGAAGVWWAINLSTVYKAAALWLVVRRGDWLR